MSPKRIEVLKRARCRIPAGTPDENGFSWPDVPPLPAPSCTFSGHGPIPETIVRALADDRALYVRFECAIPNAAMLRPRAPHGPVSEFERVQLSVSPRNDFSEWMTFEIDWRGAVASSGLRRMPGECALEAAPDVWSGQGPAPGDWVNYHGISNDAWWAEMEIPWEALGLGVRPATIGFAYGRYYAEDEEWPTLVSADWTTREQTWRTLIDPGEALIGDDALAPTALMLDALRFGRNTGRLALANDAPLSLRVVTETFDGAVIDASDVAVLAGAEEAAFDFALSREHASHVAVFSPQRLVLELRDTARERELYRVCLPMGRHLGIAVDESYEQDVGADEHASLRDRVLARICAQLPRLKRATTAQGAPSDFCLLYDDGSVAADLVADDAWERLACIVTDRFDTPDDRLVAAMALVGQKSVTNLVVATSFFRPHGSPAYHTAMHELLGPLSVIRYGGGTAVCRAAALARLLQYIENPGSGRPFVTRVLSLSVDGGPRRTVRDTGPVAFGQRADRIGAVAVDVRDGRTLLDPTALAFFPNPDGSLADMAEMLGDEELRGAGAGRLADAYGGVDLVEVERLQPDQLLSRGVYPELCANEDGPDAPPDMSLRYAPRVIMVPEGAKSEPAAGFVDASGHSGTREGAVRVACDDDTLGIAVDVHGVSLDSLDACDAAAERVHVLLDATHDHASFTHFAASADEGRDAWQECFGSIQVLFKNLATEAWQEKAHLGAMGWSASIAKTDGGYRATFVIPWALLKCSAPPRTIGLNVWIEGRAPYYEQVLLCRPRFRLPSDPVSFADVYLGKTHAVVEEADFGVPVWGGNVCRVRVTNPSLVVVPVAARIDTQLAMRRSIESGAVERVRIEPGDSADMQIAWRVDPSEKMGTGGSERATLVIASGPEEVLRASWPMGYCDSPGVFHRFGSDIAAAENPSSGEEGFLEKKTRYICSRIPRFERLTTRDGAPSDFFLRAEDGSVEFNLMAPGVLDAMGEFIAGRFDNDVDRVIGMFFLGCHPAVLRHMSGGHRVMTMAGPLSIIRGNFAGGGGNCGYHSRAFAGMLCHLKINGKPLEAHTVALRGHVVTGFRWRNSVSIQDADVGHLLLTGDGSDLATLDDMRSGRPIMTTAGGGDLARYLTAHDGAVRARRVVPDDDWLGVFPPGAPKA